jgi:hypothetical protein
VGWGTYEEGQRVSCTESLLECAKEGRFTPKGAVNRSLLAGGGEKGDTITIVGV